MTEAEFRSWLLAPAYGSVLAVGRNDNHRLDLVVGAPAEDGAPPCCRIHTSGREIQVFAPVDTWSSLPLHSTGEPADEAGRQSAHALLGKRLEIELRAASICWLFDSAHRLCLPAKPRLSRGPGLAWCVREEDSAQYGVLRDGRHIWRDALSGGPALLPPDFGKPLGASARFSSRPAEAAFLCDGNCWHRLHEYLDLKRAPEGLFTFVAASMTAGWFGRAVEEFTDLLALDLKGLLRLWQDPQESLPRRAAACRSVTMGAREEILDLMIESLKDADREIRWICAHNLRSNRSLSTHAQLADNLETACDSDVRCASAFAAGDAPSEWLTEALTSRALDPTESLQVRLRAQDSLPAGRANLPSGASGELLNSESVELRYWGCYALGRLGSPTHVSKLAERLTDFASPDGWGSVAGRARWALKRLRPLNPSRASRRSGR